ncbi:MAG: peptidase M48 [Desulfuromonas sp.]|nr:MAG: peptidase M48 [Desulfuromonas sp.]
MLMLLSLLLLLFATRLLLRWLNLHHLKRFGDVVPDGWEHVIDRERLSRSARYTFATSRLGLLEGGLGQLATLIFAFVLLPVYDRWVVSCSESLVLKGLLFFGLLTLVQAVAGLPFNAWRTFVIEARFGFNRTGWKLWLSDLAKGSLISAVLLGLLLWGGFSLVAWSPRFWWVTVWLFLACLSLLLMYVSPALIEPLFFKFTPLARPELEPRVRSLAEQAGIRVSKVRQVDASRRSGHSNAYFSGIGRVKKIVLFDTLLDQLDDNEIIAVLAHEIGHWKYGHLRKRLLVGQASLLVGCLFAWWLLQQDFLPRLVGVESLSFSGRLVVVGLVGSLAGFLLTPWSSWRSRRHERQADSFAREVTGKPGALASALMLLAKENLSNLHPHPWYAVFYFSHPPVVERVARLQGEAKTA